MGDEPRREPRRREAGAVSNLPSELFSSTRRHPAVFRAPTFLNVRQRPRPTNWAHIRPPVLVGDHGHYTSRPSRCSPARIFRRRHDEGVTKAKPPRFVA